MTDLQIKINNLIKDFEEKESIHLLSEMYENTKNSEEIKIIEKTLKELLIPYKNGSIALAQINPTPGAIELNAEKIVKYICHAQNIGIELVVFPELALIGFPLEDTINRHPILVDENIKWLKEIAKITTKTTALVGFVEPSPYNNNDNHKKYYNSIAILSGGEIQGIIRKSTVPKYSHINDFKYIEPSTIAGFQPANTLCQHSINNIEQCNPLVMVNSKNYAITIGEDCITSNSSSITEILFNKNPDIFINICADTNNLNSEALKFNLFSNIAKKYSKPTLYINQTGAIDSYSFNGASKVFDKNGNPLAQAKDFEEQFLIINPDKNLGKIYPNSSKTCTTSEQKFSLDYEYDLERTYNTIIQGIKDYFGKNGFKRAVLGLSGGLDSTICAVLLTDALGAENVFGVSMPSKLTSSESKSDAEKLANNLGIHFTQAPILDMVTTTDKCLQELFNNVEKCWDNRYSESFTMDNIQARSRAMFLWGISNEFSSCLPIATSDKSELYMGYATINGDMSGGFAPIADITKTKLFALARWLNKNRSNKNAIPENIILKRPGAELAIDPNTGKTLAAEDALMPYEFMDEVIWRIENKKEHYYDMLNSDFLYEQKNKISKDKKIQWLDKFYKRMSTALYKWKILPPTIIVDSRSVNKYDYTQPITSSRINYKGLDNKLISEKINSFCLE